MKNYLSLSVSHAVSRLIMRVNKLTVAYKLIQLCSKNPNGAPWRIIVMYRFSQG